VVQPGRGGSLSGSGATTLAKLSVDMASFCMAEPFGPHHITLPLK
jgi:hypothetical protein